MRFCTVHLVGIGNFPKEQISRLGKVEREENVFIFQVVTCRRRISCDGWKVIIGLYVSFIILTNCVDLAGKIINETYTRRFILFNLF